VGDDALRLAADALREATRAADVVARLGGDEFLVAGVYHDLPAEAEALAERIRAAIGAKVLALPDEDIPLRCSIGIAGSGGATTVESLVAAADAALYDAKRAGRDQVAWSPSAGDQPMP
jgi:two-component system cell cycle response regulator